MSEKDIIVAAIDAKSQIFTDVSDRIWEYAETRFNLKKSADDLCNILAKEGFAVERGVADMPDAFIATYGNGSPVIGILAEYDALPMLNQEAGSPMKKAFIEGEPGHGCGHHALGAGALAGAVGLKDYMAEKTTTGTIKFLGCPAEESGSGKAFMARAGTFDGIDAMLTWHPMNTTQNWSTSSLANYQIYFEFRGVSAHAAASPEHGRSALDATELMSSGVNYLREHIIPEARIHYAYIDAGGLAPNVVQPYTKVLYFIRAPKSSQVAEIYKRVVKIAEGAALMTETEMNIIWDSACAEYIVNDTLARAMYENMLQLGPISYSDEEVVFAKMYVDGLDELSKKSAKTTLQTLFKGETAERIDEITSKYIVDDIVPYSISDKAMPGSTDVGDASWQAPTAQLLTACYPVGTVAHSWQYVACGKSSIMHKGLLYAGKAIAMTGVDILEKPELLLDAKKEFQTRLDGEKYINPIPQDVKPR